MNLRIKDADEIYDINLSPITQLCGRDIQKKTFILESLSKHFSTAKYMEYERSKADNILVGDQVPGRKYFDVTRIHSREDLIHELQLSKTSLARKHLDCLLNDYCCQVEMEKIQIALNAIFQDLNEKFLSRNGALELQYQVHELPEIIHASHMGACGGRMLEELTNAELLDNYVKLISQVQKEEGDKTLILFENIDHIINRDEYLAFMKQLKNLAEQSDLWCIVSTSLDGYVFLDRECFESIHCINDIIYAMPEYMELKQYAESHYPIHKIFTEPEFDAMIITAIHNIGADCSQHNLQGYVLEKLINTSACLRVHEKKKLTLPEIHFL